MEDREPRDGEEGEELEAEILRANRPAGSSSFGTTAAEARAGEPLDRALAREEPDPAVVDEALEIVDEGLADEEGELVGDAVVERDPFAAPEEAALSVRDEAPGATDHGDPHPDDEG